MRRLYTAVGRGILGGHAHVAPRTFLRLVSDGGDSITGSPRLAAAARTAAPRRPATRTAAQHGAVRRRRPRAGSARRAPRPRGPRRPPPPRPGGGPGTPCRRGRAGPPA